MKTAPQISDNMFIPKQKPTKEVLHYDSKSGKRFCPTPTRISSFLQNCFASRIPRTVRERQQGENTDILGSFIVALSHDGKEDPIDVRVVFLENKSSKNPIEWLAILTTDL